MKSSIFLILTMLTFSCGLRSDDQVNLFGFTSVDKVSGEKLWREFPLNNSFDMKVFGDYAFIYDPEGNYQYKVIDLRTNTYKGQFGRNGDGPCELIFPATLNYSGSDPHTLGVNKRKNASYQEYSLARVASSLETGCDMQTSTLSIDFQQFVKLDEDKYFGVGVFNKRFSVYSLSADSMIQVSGEYPFEEEFQDVPVEVLAMAFQGELLKRPSSNRCVMNTLSSFNIDIVDYIPGQGISQVAKIHHWSPDFTWSDGNVLQAKMTFENRIGGISTAVSDDYIYVLFSGKKLNHTDARSGEMVLVYNWEGEPIRILEMDRAVTQLAVDLNDEFLLAYHDDGGPNFFKFKLN